MASTMENARKFIAPEIATNPNGWGPVGIPEQFKSVPYQAFNKADRIGKIADWTGQSTERQYENRRYNNRFTQYTAGGQVGSQYAYFHDGEESSFQLVDTSRPQKTMMQRANKMRQMQQQKKLIQRERDRKAQAGYATVYRGRGGVNVGARGARGGVAGRGGAMQQGGRYQQRYDQQRNKPRQPSVVVQADWEVLDDIEFTRLSKLRLPNIGNGEDIPNERYGTLAYYDKAYDRANTRVERELTRSNGTYYTVSTCEDPVVERLARENAGNVFGTDIILASLMCCARSVYSWDIIVDRVGDKLFFDKRKMPGEWVHSVDSLTVSETSNEPPSDEGPAINSPKNLAQEAVFVNQNFIMQVLKRNDERYKFEHHNVPFDDADTELPTNTAYKYRRFNLGKLANGQDCRVVIRTEHDAVTKNTTSDGIEFMTIKAFNEWDSRLSGGVDWRSKLDTQKGAVLATELKNNSFKLAKWTMQALLAGSHHIKFGYVSRVSPRDSTKHAILGTVQYKPHEFATNITLDLVNAWGVLKCIIDTCMAKPTGRYLIMKDPEKGAIRLYSLPPGTFDNEDDVSSSSGSDIDGDDEAIDADIDEIADIDDVDDDELPGGARLDMTISGD